MARCVCGRLIQVPGGSPPRLTLILGLVVGGMALLLGILALALFVWK
jgi:hypothetical protein